MRFSYVITFFLFAPNVFAQESKDFDKLIIDLDLVRHEKSGRKIVDFLKEYIPLKSDAENVHRTLGHSIENYKLNNRGSLPPLDDTLTQEQLITQTRNAFSLLNPKSGMCRKEEYRPRCQLIFIGLLYTAETLENIMLGDVTPFTQILRNIDASNIYPLSMGPAYDPELIGYWWDLLTAQRHGYPIDFGQKMINSISSLRSSNIQTEYDLRTLQAMIALHFLKYGSDNQVFFGELQSVDDVRLNLALSAKNALTGARLNYYYMEISRSELASYRANGFITKASQLQQDILYREANSAWDRCDLNEFSNCLDAAVLHVRFQLRQWTTIISSIILIILLTIFLTWKQFPSTQFGRIISVSIRSLVFENNSDPASFLAKMLFLVLGLALARFVV